MAYRHDLVFRNSFLKKIVRRLEMRPVVVLGMRFVYSVGYHCIGTRCSYDCVSLVVSA
jgi:hypothetical protein